MQFFQDYCRRHTNLKYLSADLSSPLAMDHVDLTQAPYSNNQFDLILCSHVLEHIPDDRAALAELWRILTPGGQILIQVPLHGSQTLEDPSIVSMEDRELHFGQRDHVRVYGPDITDRLTATGFHLRIIAGTAFLTAAEMKLYGIDAGEVLFACEKPSVRG
ncbi:MAG: class I SAM-dependent methyltransferase [Candidatus Neomarinimicrobiota bacterium]